MFRLNYCCNRFKSYYEIEKDFIRVPNIKIVKLNSDRFTIDSESYKRGIRGNLRFYIVTEFYEKWDVTRVLSIFIIYCPFCGKNLYKFYTNDAYANEIEGETF